MLISHSVLKTTLSILPSNTGWYRQLAAWLGKRESRKKVCQNLQGEGTDQMGKEGKVRGSFHIPTVDIALWATREVRIIKGPHLCLCWNALAGEYVGVYIGRCTSEYSRLLWCVHGGRSVTVSKILELAMKNVIWKRKQTRYHPVPTSMQMPSHYPNSWQAWRTHTHAHVHTPQTKRLT